MICRALFRSIFNVDKLKIESMDEDDYNLIAFMKFLFVFCM